MKTRTYAMTSSGIFALVALTHLIRVVGQLRLSVEGWPVPQWISPVELVVSTFLSYEGFQLFRRAKREA